MNVDWIIVGAGFTGATLAERIATQLDQKVLLVDRRDHIGGNAYDEHDEHGVLVHKYGPHIFHTNSQKVWDYLSNFTEWRPYYHHVLGVVDGRKVPLPFNLNALYMLFPPDYAKRLECLLLEHYSFGVKVPILKMRESGIEPLQELADYIYQKVFYGYTTKQWELTPEELSPAVTGRVPVHISRDDRYFQDTYQAIPLHGYTQLFKRMLKHPNIRVLLNTPYQDIAEEVTYKQMVYTGQIDAYFGYKHGALPYRSVRFGLTTLDEAQHQEVGTVNYPNEYEFTRTTEQKHLTGQKLPKTTLVTEYPQRYILGENEPYYPIPRDENREIYEKYLDEAKEQDNIIFAGRLGDYKYYNMDQATGRALSLFERMAK